MATHAAKSMAFRLAPRATCLFAPKENMPIPRIEMIDGAQRITAPSTSRQHRSA
jgi:hypothetical protein